MADDLGAETLGSYGGISYRTPHIDRLAQRGVRFENAYSAPICTPSRVQILTGQYPFRTGWAQGIWNKSREEQALSPEIPNVAQLLKSAGYATAIVGKWQLARFDDRPEHLTEMGFDQYSVWAWEYSDNAMWSTIKRIFGQSELTSRYWNPSIWQDGRILGDTDGKFGPDIYNQYAQQFIVDHQGEPFFLYYSMTLPHWPMIPPPGTSGDKDGVREGDVAQRNFSAMVAYMDSLVGTIYNVLEERGLLENTLIIFTADNGTDQEIVSSLGSQVIEGEKGLVTEAGTRVPYIAYWVHNIEGGRVLQSMTDLSDVMPTLAEVAGASLPADAQLDGVSLMPLLLDVEGASMSHPRKWVYAQLNDGWFIRDQRWRLNDRGELADMSDRYHPRLINPSSTEEAAQAAASLQEEVERLRNTSFSSPIVSNMSDSDEVRER